MNPIHRSRAQALALALLASAPVMTVFAPGVLANVEHAASEQHVSKARDYLEKGDLRAARIELKNALRQIPDHAEARLMLGQIGLLGGDLAGAESELLRSMESAPSDEAAVLLGEIYIQRNAPEQALQIVDGPASSPEMQIQRHVIAASALTALDRFDDAEARYRDILSLDTSRIEGHFGLARVAAARGGYRDASEKLREIIAARPDYAPAHILRGEVALGGGDRFAAIAAFDAAANLDPRNPVPVTSRARAHLAAGNIRAAKADAEILGRLASDAPMTNYIRAAIAFAEGDYERANQQFTQLQRYFDGFPPAILLGALIKNQRGELNQAESLLTRYLSMEPGNLDAQRAIARLRLRSGNFGSAIDILEDILRQTPEDSESLRQLASAYLASGDVENAAGAFRGLAASGTTEERSQAKEALRLLSGENPSGEMQDPQLRLGVLMASDSLSTGNIENAERQIASLERSHGGTASVLALKGGLSAARGDAVTARELLDSALDRDPELYAALVAAEQLDQASGEPDATLDRLRRLLGQRPDSVPLTLRLAEHLTEQGALGDAIALLQGQSRRQPDVEELRRSLISKLILAERPDEAAAEAREAVIAGGSDGLLVFATSALLDLRDPAALDAATRLAERMPGSPRAVAMQAEALVLAGRRSDAYALLSQAQKRWPGDTGIAGTHVNLAVAAKDGEAAKRAVEALARHNPSAAARMRARALASLGQPIVAVEVLETAFARAPDSRLAVELFNTRRRAGRDAAAFDGLEDWLARNPDDRMALITRATALMETGRKAEAESTYARFLRLEPGNPIALNNYAWLRHDSGMPDALDFAERAYLAAAGTPEIADTYGYMLVEYGKLSDGLAMLSRARDAAPNNPEIGYHYAYALSKAGKLRDARAVLTAVLDGAGDFTKRTEAEALMATLR